MKKNIQNTSSLKNKTNKNGLIKKYTIDSSIKFFKLLLLIYIKLFIQYKKTKRYLNNS